MANNPAKNIDVNGDYIDIYIKEAQKDDEGNIIKNKNGKIKYKSTHVRYHPGKIYEGDNKFTATVFKSLDKIYETEEGKVVIDALDKSSNIFKISENNSGAEYDFSTDENPDTKDFY